MDGLAGQGTTPICAASRASLLSGVYERTHRFNFATGDIRNEYMTTAYPRELHKAGDRTGFYGKYGIRYPEEKLDFDEYETFDRNSTYDDRWGYYYKTLDGRRPGNA